MKNREVFKPVLGYEGIYEINNFGVVRSVDRLDCNGAKRKSVVMTPYYDKGGYLRVGLRKNGKQKNYLVHKLVALSFIVNDDPENKTQVHHKNSVRTDNRVSNLQWVDTKEHAILDNRSKKISVSKKAFFSDENNRKRWKTFNNGEKNGNYGRKYTEEEIAKRTKHLEKPLYQYDLNMNLIKKYNCVKEAAEENGFDRTCLSRAARGEHKNNVSYKYKWFYDEQ